jgi:hypothetical protein
VAKDFEEKSEILNKWFAHDTVRPLTWLCTTPSVVQTDIQTKRIRGLTNLAHDSPKEVLAVINIINIYGPALKPCAQILGTSAMSVGRSKTVTERGAAGFAGAVVGTAEDSPAWRPPIC